jgi:dipeptidyl aminopeptidase/acylaminoacyl peptidase
MNRFFSTCFLAFFLILNSVTFGQKIPLTHDVYDSWKDMERPNISLRNGLISFEINPQDGDGMLHITNKNRSFERTVERGTRALLDPNGNFVAFTIKPTKAEVREAKMAKKKPDQMPKDSGGVYFPASDEWFGYSKVKSFGMGEKDGKWVGILTEHKVKEPKEEESADSTQVESKPARKSKKKSNKKETLLTLLNTQDKTSQEFLHVEDYSFAEQGNFVAISHTSTDSLEQSLLTIFDANLGQAKQIFKEKGELSNLAFSKDGKMLVFHFSADTGKVKVFDLYLWKEAQTQATKILDAASAGIPTGWVVSQHQKPRFSDDGTRLFLSTFPKPKEEPKDTLTKDEKVIFDLWSWTDTLLQTQQKVNLKRELQKSYLGVYIIKDQKYTQLADKKLETVRTDRKGNGKYAIGIDRTPYQWSMTWDYPSGSDYYLIEIETGERRIIAKNNSTYPSLSPDGKYLAFYQPSDSTWYGMSTRNMKSFPLTSQIKSNFYDELVDTPSEPWPYGMADWSADSKSIILYDRYDIWQVFMSGRKDPICLTSNHGAYNKIRYRYLRLNSEQDGIPTDEPMLISLFDEKDKQSGFATISLNKQQEPKLLLKNPFRYSVRANSEDLSTLLWTRQSYAEYPNLWVSSASFANSQKLSNTNQQQSQYLWGTVELTKWHDFNRNQVEGLLYLPENFDPTKEYPMMVYFYERHADNLHSHHKPAPGRSVICPTLYASNGYIVFMPDIAYTEGLPGKSAYDAIISGTMAMVNRGFVDINKIGVQGQSWGGYQIAYLVTQTDLFKAASAGAPVSNMTSAYGGIRWGSGLARMFQYERTQSRIGATLWERPLHYIENSPLFYAPRVNTPLLIRHDDADEAVPWYQGIELFLALRRLEKPVWMINYNDEPHNLVRRANRIDWTIRMQQFFDHYLKDAPAPKWLKQGIPQTQKGEMGYELVE